MLTPKSRIHGWFFLGILAGYGRREKLAQGQGHSLENFHLKNGFKQISFWFVLNFHIVIFQSMNKNLE
jgi:hypothetical protein